MEDNKIDFVIMWVDGNDKEWQKEKFKYDNNKDINIDKREIRYRDWDNLKYWFRSVETFAPWVNKIHFVTYGHLPEWLNIDNPKLNIVKHSDFIPEQYLPTFSANPIELNLHRIKNISDKFVLFNDDMFIIDNVKETDFFKNNLPCDMAVINATFGRDKIYYSILNNDMIIINSRFKKNQVIKADFFKWINMKYGKKFIRTLLGLPWSGFIGFYNKHVCASYLKETYEEVWKEEYDILDETCKHKFRNKDDVNQNLMEYWQFATGKFYPKKIDCKYFRALEQREELKKAILKQKNKFICINDSEYNNENFEIIKQEVKDCFEKILPNKSSFEI